MKKKEIMLSAAAVLLSLVVVVTGCSISEKLKEDLGGLVESMMNVTTAPAVPDESGTPAQTPEATDPKTVPADTSAEKTEPSTGKTEPSQATEPSSSLPPETPPLTEPSLVGTRAVVKTGESVNVYGELLNGSFSGVVGLMDEGAVGTIDEAGEGWFRITSGKVQGYVDAGKFLTGEEAASAKTEFPFAVVDVETLRLRNAPSADAKTLGVLSSGSCYRVLSESGAYTELQISPELTGFVESIHLVVAEREVEAKTLAEISQEVMEGDKLIADQQERESIEASSIEESIKESVEQSIAEASSIQASIEQSLHDATTRETDEYDQLTYLWTPPELPDDLSTVRRQICQLASYYVKRLKYVEGGASLTSGCDSPGFAKAIYGHFGYVLPPTSKLQRECGREVKSFDNIRPGDLIIYKSSVGIYVGGGYIVRAGMEGYPANKDKYDYKEIVTIRNIVGD